MKKYKINIILCVLSIIFIIIGTFMYVVHIPYHNEKKSINTNKYQIMEQYDIPQFNTFEQYNGQAVYYIGTTDEYVYVFNTDHTTLVKVNKNQLQEDKVKHYIRDNEKMVDPISLTFGYENGVLTYNYTQNSEISIYMYFNAITGDLIKIYEFGDNGKYE